MTDKEQQLLSEIKERGKLEYQARELAPLIKHLLARCEDIETQLVAEKSAACCNFRDLRLNMTELLDSLETEDAV